LGFSNRFHKRARGYLARGDILATLLFAVQAKNLFTARIGKRTVVRSTQDALDLSNSLTLTEQFSNRTADIIGQERLDVNSTSLGFVSQVGCVGITGNTRYVTDELGSRLLLRLLRRSCLNAMRLRLGFGCGTHIANLIMVEPLGMARKSFSFSKPQYLLIERLATSTLRALRLPSSEGEEQIPHAH